MQGHLIPRAAKGRGAGHVATSRVDFHLWQRVFGFDRGKVRIWVPKARERTPESCGVERRESYGWKLLHREEGPTLERDTIDTPERARTNYRYVIGQHFGLVNIYERAHRTCNAVQRI